MDLYLKLFGTETAFLSLGNSKGFDIDDAISQVAKFIAGAADQTKRLSVSFNVLLVL